MTTTPEMTAEARRFFRRKDTQLGSGFVNGGDVVETFYMTGALEVDAVVGSAVTQCTSRLRVCLPEDPGLYLIEALTNAGAISSRVVDALERIIELEWA